MNTLDLLTGPDAADLLTAAVATAGGRLVRWRVVQVDNRPGDLITVAYAARVSWPDGERDDVLGASASAGATASAGAGVGASGDASAGRADGAGKPGVLTLSDGEQQVSVWCVPHDPDLPGLATVHDRGALARLLTSFGVTAAADLRTRLVTYRPRRRAVLQVSAGAGTWFLKVVPVGEADQLHRRHRLLHEAGVPAPRSLGRTDDGVLVLEELPGTGLRALLSGPAGGHGPQLPTAEDVIRVLDRFPAGVLELPRRKPWSLLCDRYAAVIAAALPSERDRVEQFARTVLTGLAGADPGTDPTHGDFYEAQLLVTGGRISGLLDVDTAGPGHRADDLACALAHCDALALSHPASAVAAAALARRWRLGFRSRVDPVDLRLREAGVLLSLATGPHRVQRPDWQQATVQALDGIERVLDGS